MTAFQPGVAPIYQLILLFFILLFHVVVPGNGYAQLIGSDRYELRAAPDLWYNTTDGILAGIRFRGEDPQSFLDGPHRFNAGIWLGTRIPDTPVSYHLVYTNPVESISGNNSVGSFRAVSSIRTGLHLHEAGMQKRWQPGFDELVTRNLGTFVGVYHRFDDDYLHYESLWQNDPVFYLRADARIRDRNTLGRWTLGLTGFSGTTVDPVEDFIDYSGQTRNRPDVLGIDGMFGKFELEMMQQVSLSTMMQLRARFFAGVSSHTLPRELRYLSSDAPAFEWIHSGFTRAKGTIPQSWISAGRVHIPGGGPGLRGYSYQTAAILETGMPVWSQYAFSVNMDLIYPNPIDAYITGIPYIGDFLGFESYLLTDAGLLNEGSEWQDIRMDAGTGFMLSLNIPDYMGQDRGFFIRYELPLWISDALENENSFEIRHLVGMGAHFRF